MMVEMVSMTKILKDNPRTDYLRQENLRVEASPLLAKKYPSVKSLTVDLGYHDMDRPSRSSQIKYTVNLKNARSVFRIGCQNSDCVGGDFDLSETLAKAVRSRKTAVSDELCCRGWKNAATIDTVRCGRVLRYKLTLGY